MRKMRITIDVPIVDLTDEARKELCEMSFIDPQDMPNLADYLEDKDEGMMELAHAIISPIFYAMKEENCGEMFAGTDVYVTLEQGGNLELVDAVWVDE